MSVGARVQFAAVWIAGVASALGAVSPASAGSPQISYMLQCQGCHLADGSGAPGAVPSLDGMGRFLGVPGGRAYLVRVPGSAQSPLSDGELAELLNWMLRSFTPDSIPAHFVPFSTEEVAGVRRPPLIDVDAARADLLRRIQSRDREPGPSQLP
ncbi:MAG: cytochrome c [Myxococcales bacterium]|nr:cytochrome c [Myxococcales bacterium]